jgi:hypothetical protein
MRAFFFNSFVACFLIYLFSGCQTLKNYDRTVSFSYENPQAPGAKLSYELKRK